jgi:hypothetical protein
MIKVDAIGCGINKHISPLINTVSSLIRSSHFLNLTIGNRRLAAILRATRVEWHRRLACRPFLA